MGLLDWLFGKQNHSAQQKVQEPVLSESQIAEMYSPELDTIETLVKCCLLIDKPWEHSIGIIVNETYIFFNIDARYDQFCFSLNPESEYPEQARRHMTELCLKQNQISEAEFNFFLSNVPVAEIKATEVDVYARRKATLTYPLKNPNHDRTVFQLLAPRLQKVVDSYQYKKINSITIDETRCTVFLYG